MAKKTPNKAQRLIGSLVGGIGSFLSLPLTLPVAGITSLTQRLKRVTPSNALAAFGLKVAGFALGALTLLLYAVTVLVLIPYYLLVRLLTFMKVIAQDDRDVLTVRHHELAEGRRIFTLELSVGHKRRQLASGLVDLFLDELLRNRNEDTFGLHKESQEAGPLTWGQLSLAQCRRRIAQDLENLEGWYQQNELFLFLRDPQRAADNEPPALEEVLRHPPEDWTPENLRERIDSDACAYILYWLEQGALNVEVQLLVAAEVAALDRYLQRVEEAHGKDLLVRRPSEPADEVAEPMGA